MTVGAAHVTAAARGGGIVFGGKLYAWAARFAIAVLLARLLGADQYGLYSVSLSIAAVAAALAVFGLDAAMIRYLAVFVSRGDGASLRGSIHVGAVIPAVLGLAASAALVLASDALATEVVGDGRLAPLLRITALIVPALVANSLLSAMLQGLRRFGASVGAEQILQPTLRGALIVAFAVAGMDVSLALVATLVSTVAVGVLMAARLRASLPPAHDRPRRPARELIGFSLPVYFSNVVHTFGGNLQTLLLGSLASVASAGIFAVANQIQLIGSLFHASIVRASMPLFAELHDSGNRGRLEHLYQTTSKWTFSLNVPFFLAALLYPEALLSIFGADFVEGATALVILAVGAIVNAGTGTSGAMLDMTGHTVLKLLNSSVSVGLAIALNLLLIPLFGLVGAAVAAVASVATVNAMRVVEVARFERVGPYNREYLKPIAAGLLATALSLLTSGVLLAGLAGPLPVIGGIGVLVATYAVVLHRLGLSDDDREILGRVGRRLRRVRRGGSPKAAGEVGEAVR